MISVTSTISDGYDDEFADEDYDEDFSNLTSTTPNGSKPQSPNVNAIKSMSHFRNVIFHPGTAQHNERSGHQKLETDMRSTEQRHQQHEQNQLHVAQKRGAG